MISVQRRSPFGENPAVGARGTQTQQRILRAALDVFGADGYEGCRVDRITATAGCSRPTFYQYFSSKEDLFRQLAGEVARSMLAITDTMDLVTADIDGWHALRDWLERYADLHDAYWPVFVTFASAEGSDAAVASGAARVRRRHTKSLAEHLDPVASRVEDSDAVASLFLNTVNRALRYRQLFVHIAPHRTPDRDRMLDSLAEILHRSLFGRRDGVTVKHRPTDRRETAAVPVAPVADPTSNRSRLGRDGRRTRSRLLDAGANVFATKRYHETRVDDIVAAAEVSHGTFYRYFDNKDDIFRVIAARSGRRVFRMLDRLPDLAGAPGSASSGRLLRRWLTEYAATWADEGPIFRVWVEALSRDQELSDITAQAMDAIRARLGRFLAPRGFGDLEMDAFLLLSTLDLASHGADRPSAAAISNVDHLVMIIRCGFLGVDGGIEVKN